MGDNPAPQQIGYLNVIPACIATGGMLSMPQFESYGQTVTKLNQILQHQPIQGENIVMYFFLFRRNTISILYHLLIKCLLFLPSGRIINIETQDVKFESWNGSVDPDCSFWRKSGNRSMSNYFLNIIRVFYEAGPPCYEKIGQYIYCFV